MQEDQFLKAIAAQIDKRLIMEQDLLADRTPGRIKEIQEKRKESDLFHGCV